MKVNDIIQSYESIETKDEFDQNVMNGISNKRKVHRKRRKMMASGISIICLFLIANFGCYAFSTNYRSWLGERLGISEKGTHSIKTTTVSNDITMEVVASRVVGNTGVILVTFAKNNNKEFIEDINLDEMILAFENKTLSDSIIGFSTQLQNGNTVLECLITFQVDEKYLGKSIELHIKDLVSKETGKLIYEGDWITSITLNQDTPRSTTDRLKTSVKVIVEDTRYELEELMITDTTIEIKANEIEKLTSSDNGISSFYGAKAKIVYKDKRVMNTTCSPDVQGNLIIWFEDAKDTKRISQIYINNVPILEE